MILDFWCLSMGASQNQLYLKKYRWTFVVVNAHTVQNVHPTAQLYFPAEPTFHSTWECELAVNSCHDRSCKRDGWTVGVERWKSPIFFSIAIWTHIYSNGIKRWAVGCTVCRVGLWVHGILVVHFELHLCLLKHDALHMYLNTILELH